MLLFILFLSLTAANWTACTSQGYRGSVHQVSERYFPVPLDHGASNGSTLNLYVRRFTRGNPQRHVFLVAGGPGQSGRTFEEAIHAMFNEFDNCWLYVVDHRGTGKSGKLSKKNQYAIHPGTCPQINTLRYYTVANATSDLIMAVETIKQESGGEVFALGSSYGTLVLYRALIARPNLFTGILLNDFFPTYEPVSSINIGSTLIDICQENANCRARFPNLEAASAVMKDLSNPDFNRCTRHMRDLDGWHRYGSPKDVGPLVQRFFSMILEALYVPRGSDDALVHNPLLVALSFLYQMHRCDNLGKFGQFVGDLISQFQREGIIFTVSSPNQPRIPRSNLLVAADSDDVKEEVLTNRFQAKPDYMNALINNYINYSEMHQADYSSCIAQSKDHLYGYCSGNSMYVQQRKARFSSHAYQPKSMGVESVTTSSRIVIVGGMLDPQTPLAISQFAAKKISTNATKAIFAVKHSTHGSLYKSGCHRQIIRAMLEGKTSAAESCVQRNNKETKFNWSDFPQYSQYLWPMDAKEDLTSKGSSSRILIAVVVLVLLAIAVVGIWWWYRKRSTKA